ncbi:hypothetical protein CcNV_032 [Crangon crangon nudivirus]|uniref:Uncharacterized protein n=1 Tax=Crangon crangon nudivirus TaxID=2880838 RepID=A0AAE8Y0K6_9VIRU|nr:hypothetical protein QKT25_gp032 [Crangon crangon nudivirus]UBZ25516.1 hypothetical protein CcNV_032 [Crangon crangon nudivirus]
MDDNINANIIALSIILYSCSEKDFEDSNQTLLDSDEHTATILNYLKIFMTDTLATETS